MGGRHGGRGGGDRHGGSSGGGARTILRERCFRVKAHDLSGGPSILLHTDHDPFLTDSDAPNRSIRLGQELNKLARLTIP